MKSQQRGRCLFAVLPKAFLLPKKMDEYDLILILKPNL